LDFADVSELREILVAWTTRTEVIEPFFGFRERQRSSSDSLENVQARALSTPRIGKLFEQTSAQGI
jgi:hypothetical protein